MNGIKKARKHVWILHHRSHITPSSIKTHRSKMKTIEMKMNECSLRDKMIETPYIFYINSNTSSCETEPTPIKYVVGMHPDEDENTILSCVCKDIMRIKAHRDYAAVTLMRSTGLRRYLVREWRSLILDRTL